MAQSLHPVGRNRSLAALLLAVCFAAPAMAQGTAPSDAAPATVTLPQLPTQPPPSGTQMDRVVAIVNGFLILDSDVDQERRFAALLPYGEAAGPYSRDDAIDRLINRELILQQIRLQPQQRVSTATAQQDLESLRKSLPNCKQFQCETPAGWESFLATQGFTDASITDLWRQRMEVLGFIEQRFRMGMKVSPEEIAFYYHQTLLPQYAAMHATPAPLSAVSDRIQQVLLEQKVTKLLDDWLQNLREQGTVVVLHPGEVAP
jgi:hypothetical protein